jgi:hypothetical protein
MKIVKHMRLLVLVFMVAGIAALPSHAGSAPIETKSTGTVQTKSAPTVQTKTAAPEPTKSTYTQKECVQCHANRVNDIKTAGGKHRNVPCVGCHLGHPPEVKKPIALCSKCHVKEKRSHFELTGCLSCHQNPHTPLTVTFKGKDACLDCHFLQQEQIMRNKSKHTALDCSACHDVHRKVPQCTQCHLPHKGKISGGCKQCHNAHMPKTVYAADFPSKDCGVCHKMVTDLMKTTASKHKPLECAFCHKGNHRVMPACKDCHGPRHPGGILAKFPKCTACHNSPHDLNNWTVAETKEVAGNAAKKPSSELSVH